ncbi:ABC transporter substrate-binding protein [Streptosporangium sp. NBC_01756]|uniref:ABC transporter substrate-binding protein n=1 Tax=Streptosporangium sp. NBC_01756 TaxID=2975950 RepID=UPI002DDA7CDE|nr:ABC transporter substrate-binding protein [Streptosporangium sp. NBC_01756]WSC88307.1 ABC transporter substrate-binding protein [Streptosporangium sp. NBC_01756]
MFTSPKPLLAATLLASLVALTACGSDNASGSGDVSAAAVPGGGAPRPGGSLVLGENADEPTCLDPHQLSTTNTTVIDRPIFDSLLWQDATGKLQPWLAERWKVSDDGLTYTFTLREGVKFHDGARWDAEALKTNFEHMKDPATKSPLAAAYIAPYEDSKVIDEHTLEVHLSAPYSPFLNVLAQSYLAMISPKQIKEAPQSTCEHPIGSGPFVFDKWTKGQSITYRKNPDYTWGPPGAGHTGPAYLDGLEIRFLGEDATRYNALLSGEVNVIDNTPPSNVEDVKANPDLGFSTVDRPGHPFSIWRNTGRAPFDDVKVRQALTLAVDRKAIIDSVSFGQWKIATGFVTPSTPDYASALEGRIGYDPAEAGRLLDEAGWTAKGADGIRTKDGRRLTAIALDTGVNPQNTQILVQTQAAAAKAGIDIQIQNVTAQVASDRTATGDFDISVGIWTTNTADVLWIQYASDNITTDERRGQNTTRLSDGPLDKLLKQARETTDGKARADLYARAQARLIELAPAVPLYNRPSLVSFQKKVQGLGWDHAYGAVTFYDTWLG